MPTFNKPAGSRSKLPTDVPAGLYFSQISGGSTAGAVAPTSPATAAVAAGTVGAPSSLAPCYPTDKGECDVTVAPILNYDVF